VDSRSGGGSVVSSARGRLKPMSGFRGFVKDVKYQAHLTSALPTYTLEQFDVNTATSAGQIQTPFGVLSYSKWVSPKPTRSYPFERIYNTYNGQKIITIIPIVKDEGLDGDRDFVSFKTFSWMSLLNIYVVLAYYSSATKRRGTRQKITEQQFDPEFVRQQIVSITNYRQSALHWNRTLLETQFVPLLQTALATYQTIASETGVPVHGHSSKIETLLSGLTTYQQTSLDASRRAAMRETKVSHALETANINQKYVLEIENYLGGVYSLAPDGIVLEGDKYVILESKNTSKGRLPQLSDIKDGLFKLILFANLDRLQLNGQDMAFTTRLLLTSKRIEQQIQMPCTTQKLEQFLAQNRFSENEKKTLHQLNQETQVNPRLEVVVQHG
jgi:hypothetical protein